MSSIEVTVGEATVLVRSVVDTESAAGTTPHYRPRDVTDAAAGVLLAINTPESVRLAGELFKLTAGTQPVDSGV